MTQAAATATESAIGRSAQQVVPAKALGRLSTGAQVGSKAAAGLAVPPATQALSPENFERVRKLIYARAGISLGANKQAMVSGRLAKRLRALKIGSLDEYLCLLDDPKAQEWQQFTNALTTNLTAFFREPHHFEHLAQVLRAARGQDTFSIWCTAASTGEEPYSLAMVASEVANQGPRHVSIVASDIDTQVLATAARGVYPMDRVESLPSSRLKKHFLKGRGPQSGNCKVRPDRQKNIDFCQINLLDVRWPLEGLLDVIICRNVLIYFDKQTQKKLVRRFAQMLRPGGHLYVGHSESQFECEDLLRLIGRTTYQRNPQ